MEYILEREGFDSETLWNEMAVQSSTAINKINQALQFVIRNRLQCVLVGGMAVAHYTARAITPDVDFMSGSLPAVETALQKENIPFAALASDGRYSGIQVPSMDADFLDANTGNKLLNGYILKTAQTAKIGGMSVPIIDPGVLAIQKFWVGRDKDTDDAFKLLKVANKPQLKLHLNAIGKSLRGSEIDAPTIWSYAQALG
jgi:hypothetical protein